MKIYYTGSGYLPAAAPSGLDFPCVVMCYDNWNDYGYVTLYPVVIFTGPEDRLVRTAVKILQRDPENPLDTVASTHLPKGPMEELPAGCCSLGQSMEYYTALESCGPDVYIPLLRAMRDVALFPDIDEEFSSLPGFDVSLLRTSEPRKAYREVRALLAKQNVAKVLSFTFSCKVKGAAEPHVVSMDFSDHPTQLNRTIVLIGRNGTGKTEFLGEFAQAFSGRILAEEGLGFSPERPSFSQVIAVSYSAFDEFERPEENNEEYRYTYIGIRVPEKTESSRGVVLRRQEKDESEETRLLSQAEIRGKLLESMERISADSSRMEFWLNTIAHLLEDSGRPSEESLRNLSFYQVLSSGQKILVAIMTQLIATIERDSILLFDEPELHLHPEVFAALVRSIDLLLAQYDSFAIIATHSPLLLQETLGQQVRVFQRLGDVPLVTDLGIECFGENIATLTREVFSVDGAAYNFRWHLDRLLKYSTAGQIEAMFPDGLPVLAKSYLYAKSGHSIN